MPASTRTHATPGKNAEPAPRILPAPRGWGKALPRTLQEGIERLSGVSLDDVTVHRSSPRPNQHDAQALVQGSEIHLAPGGDGLLAHEAWHVVQQRQGRVRPTRQDRGLGLNEEPALEREADAMAERARQPMAHSVLPAASSAPPLSAGSVSVAQCGNGKSPRKKYTGGGRYHPYAIGQHGAKKKEQQRLGGMFGISVTGTSHESEHTVGFEPLNQTSGEKRGKSSRARALENTAPAYQEVKSLHRAHIGTGTHGTPDESGFTSTTYRQAQRSLIESGDVSSAVQLNQLGYAFDPSFSTSQSSKQGKAATESFNTMVGGMSSFTFATGGSDTTVPVDPKQRAEMELSRMVALTGKYPTQAEEDEVKKKHGVA